MKREFCALGEKDMRDQYDRLQKETEERKTKESLDAALIDEINDQSAKQIAGLKAENTRLRFLCRIVCCRSRLCARGAT